MTAQEVNSHPPPVRSLVILLLILILIISLLLTPVNFVSLFDGHLYCVR